MSEIHWSFYPRVIAVSRARAWIEINEKLLRAPKTIDAYARGLEDFLSVCDRLGIEYETATTADIASYVDEMAHRPRKRSPRSNNVNRAGALANKTMQQRLTAIRLFYDFLVEQRRLRYVSARRTATAATDRRSKRLPDFPINIAFMNDLTGCSELHP